METAYYIRQHNRVWIGVKSVERQKGRPRLEIVWVRDLATAARFSSRINAEDFITEHKLLNAKVKSVKSNNASKLSP